nr:DUF1932 domain-containing protein [Streptomyces sp. F63]
MAGAGAGTVDRLVTGTRWHAGRRADEMAAAAGTVRELGIEPVVARAARDLLLRMPAGPEAGEGGDEAAWRAEGGPGG